MSAGYETLIVTFSDPIKVLDNMFADADAWWTDSLKGWVEDYESTRFTQINGHTAVITSEYNMPCVKEWLTRCTAIADIKEFWVRGGGNTAHTPFVTTEKTSEMKYYFILTDGRDAWVQFVYLPTQDEASGYIRDLRSVGISVHGYNLWNKDTRPIAERTLERVLQRIKR